MDDCFKTDFIFSITFEKIHEIIVSHKINCFVAITFFLLAQKKYFHFYVFQKHH